MDPATKRLEREGNFEEFLKVLTRQGRPAYLPFYEHLASSGFISRRTGTRFNEMTMSDEDYWPTYVDFWLGMGFDCVPMEIGFDIKLPASRKGARSHGSESKACLRSWEEFETFDWPSESAPIEFRHFERVAALLPDGIKIVGGACGGPYEWVSDVMGVMGLGYALMDDPDLVAAIFEKFGRLYDRVIRTLGSMESVGALRQGDDLGFKTSMFLSPEHLREYVFPIYGRMAGEAHRQEKPFILHSCGNLAEVYDDLIDDCHIDAKHSFEDVILPVQDFKARYGDRVTALGGLDVDVICRSSAEDLRNYTRKTIEACFEDGHWALGTGNSLPDFMPVENYILVLEEGLKVGGG